jgi:hypothetical protein
VYVPPELCTGEWDLSNNGDDSYQEQIAAAALNISGATVNVFKLLGVHEQGRLVDLVGEGEPMNGSADVFDGLASAWVSPQTGLAVLTDPAWVGYDFGITKTSYGATAYGPSQPNTHHITSIRLVQPVAGRRALQLRVERSNGGFRIDPTKILYTGTGNGTIGTPSATPEARRGTIMLSAVSPTSFTAFFTGDTTEVLGTVTVGQRYLSKYAAFTILAGTVPFSAGDMFSIPIDMDWYRVDVVNVPDDGQPNLIRLKQSSPSRFWRIVPTSFSGVTTDQPWELQSLELFDWQSTRLDDVQDPVFLENRDRDYANQSISLKAAYQPFDALSDLSKFGFQVADVYNFTVSFASMVKALGRPVVVGDVLEIPSETQYDHNLRPVRKFLEVSDTSWSAEGFTTNWRPIIFRFQASQLIPSQEHRDLLGTVDTQKYVVDDGSFFEGIQQIQTGPLTATEATNEEARKAVPEQGANILEQASGMNRFNEPGTYDGTGLYVEDGLPPDGLPYEEGYKLPDVAGQLDGAYYRLNYDPKLKIPARLYKFSSAKNKWVYVETDRRDERSSHKPSQREIFNQPKVVPLSSKGVR